MKIRLTLRDADTGRILDTITDLAPPTPSGTYLWSWRPDSSDVRPGGIIVDAGGIRIDVSIETKP